MHGALLNLANLSLTENANQASPLLARAEALAQLGRPKESAEAYRHALDVAERGSSEMLEAYYGLLTTMDDNPSAAEAQINTCFGSAGSIPARFATAVRHGQLLAAFATARPGSPIVRNGGPERESRPHDLASGRSGGCRRDLLEPGVATAGRYESGGSGAETRRGRSARFACVCGGS